MKIMRYVNQFHQEHDFQILVLNFSVSKIWPTSNWALFLSFVFEKLQSLTYAGEYVVWTENVCF